MLCLLQCCCAVWPDLGYVLLHHMINTKYVYISISNEQRASFMRFKTKHKNVLQTNGHITFRLPGDQTQQPELPISPASWGAAAKQQDAPTGYSWRAAAKQQDAPTGYPPSFSTCYSDTTEKKIPGR